MRSTTRPPISTPRTDLSDCPTRSGWCCRCGLPGLCPPNWPSPASKIRRACGGNGGILAAVIFELVLGADMFDPLTGGAAIDHHRGPGRGENAGIFHRDLELEMLARVRGIELDGIEAARINRIHFALARDRG